MKGTPLRQEPNQPQASSIEQQESVEAESPTNPFPNDEDFHYVEFDEKNGVWKDVAHSGQDKATQHQSAEQQNQKDKKRNTNHSPLVCDFF